MGQHSTTYTRFLELMLYEISYKNNNHSRGWEILPKSPYYYPMDFDKSRIFVSPPFLKSDLVLNPFVSLFICTVS